jgi:hypothetical protein
VGAEYHREDILEPMIFQPGVGRHPNESVAAFVGKTVLVQWMPPVFSHTGFLKHADGHLEDLHSITWIAWVPIMGRQVPASFLVRPPRLPAPKGNA